MMRADFYFLWRVHCAWGGCGERGDDDSDDNQRDEDRPELGIHMGIFLLGVFSRFPDDVHGPGFDLY